MGLPYASYGWLTAAEGAGIAISSLFIIKNKNINTVNPVSYTHLDVYKRQLLISQYMACFFWE